MTLWGTGAIKQLAGHQMVTNLGDHRPRASDAIRVYHLLGFQEEILATFHSCRGNVYALRERKIDPHQDYDGRE